MGQKLQTKVATLDSREVAEMVEKRHDHLIRDIEKYCEHLKKSQNPTLGADDYFIESEYQSGTGKSYKNYQITKKGCELIAHKMTGEKGTVFSAAYINRFHEMEDTIKDTIPVLDHVKEMELQAKHTRAAAMLLNAQVRMINTLMANTKDKNLSQIAKDVMKIKSVEQVTGMDLTHYLPECEKLYSATEVGEMLGVSAMKIGKTANAYGLKTDTYGKMVMSKSQHSSKEVSQFLYNDKGVQMLSGILSKAVKTA